MTQPNDTITLFREMKRIRMIEEAIADRYSEQKMRCPVHLSIGQEAVSVAAGHALNIDDLAVSTHRSHGHYLGKGGDLSRMIAELYGKQTGCAGGRGGSMHLIDKSVGFVGSTAIVGGTIPVGVGLGLSMQLQNTQQISCVFLGDAAVEEGVFYESVNFAAVRKLPVLFICENNFYSIYTDLETRQPKGREIWKMVDGLGVKSHHFDDPSVPKLIDVISDLASEARNDGPRFLEVKTYRWREHCGPNFDHDLAYRSMDEIQTWEARDPLNCLEAQLLENGLSSETHAEIISEITHEIDAAFEFAEASDFPSQSTLSTHVLAGEQS